MITWVRSILEKKLRAKKQVILFRGGKAVGDQLCMTALVEALHREHGIRSIVFTHYSEWFRNNPKVVSCLHLSTGTLLGRAQLRILRALKSSRVIEFAAANSGEDYVKRMRAEQPMHLVQANSRELALPMSWRNIKTEIYFTPSEEKKFEGDFPQLMVPFVCVHSHGKTLFTPNKSWSVEKIQAVINETPQITWVQLGGISDAPLCSVIDLRGKTNSLRALAFVISRSQAVVCTEGLYNHITAAFERPCVVVHSGFSPTELAHYSSTSIVVREPQVTCAPCWLLTPCPVAGKPCTSDITSQQVTSALRNIVTRR